MKQYFFLFLIIILINCNNRKVTIVDKPLVIKPYPHTINISEGLNNSSEIKLSSIADSIRYIVLSKEKDVLIKNFMVLQMSDNDFYINLSGLIHRFDHSGKFLNKIGSKGRGPTEYLPGSPFSVNPYSNIIYIKRSYGNYYLSFKPSGELIGKHHFETAININDFVCLSDSIFLYNYWYIGSTFGGNMPKEMNLCGLFSKSGRRIQTIEHPAKNPPPGINLKRFVAGPPSFNFFNDEIVLNYTGDTIYKINNNSITKGFIFNWGKIPHKQKFEELYYISPEQSNSFQKSGQLFETPEKAFFGLKKVDTYLLLEYDKYTGITKSMLTEKDRYGFIDDLDGGATFYPKWTNRTGDIWIAYNDAFDFKNMHSEELLSKSNSVYPDRKEALRKFLNTLKIDDNPVLKIVYLKKSR